jgi:hypothetical protein
MPRFISRGSATAVDDYKESHMKVVEPTKPYRKSGGAQVFSRSYLRAPIQRCRFSAHSERIGSRISSVFGPSSLWRWRKRTHAFQRRIASSLPVGRTRSASSNSPSALTIQS